jgi:uncharacterized phage protein gp47/JayE
MAELTLEGLVIRSLQDIREEINAEVHSRIAPSIDMSDGSIEGQWAGIVAEQIALAEEGLELVNGSLDPDSATGAQLDAISALTGTLRREARPSLAALTLTGTPLTIVSEGSRASQTVTEVEFVTLEDATIEELDAWEADTSYALGSQVTNDGNAYVATVAGTSDSSGGPTGEDSVIVDNTVTWRFMGEGTGAIDVPSAAAEVGPTLAVSGTITEIETPVSGWNGVINLLDATLGRLEETDEDLRLRRELELAASGSSTKDGIRAALLQVTGVTAVTVFVNNSMVTDPDGMPPKSVEALVQGGDDQDIWDSLLANVAAGIETHGTEDGTAADSQGTEIDVSFSRPEEIEIYIDIELHVDPLVYPSDGDDQVKLAIVLFGDAQPTGKDAVAFSLGAQAFKVPGVLDVLSIDIGASPSPSGSTTIAISLRQLAQYDTSRILVDSSSTGVP